MKQTGDWVKGTPFVYKKLRPLIRARRWLIDYPRHRREENYDVLLQRVLAGRLTLNMPEFSGAYNVNIRSDVTRRILLHGSYEDNLALLCRRLLDPRRDAIDVGANVGFFTGLMAAHLTTGRHVASLEPTPSVYELLLENIARNNYQDRVIALPLAASDDDGKENIRICADKEEYSTCGTLVHPSARFADVETRSVQCITLDTLCLRYGLSPGFVKIDVEGYEHKVLLGAKRVLRQDRPVILSELSDYMLRACGSSSKEVIQFLNDCRYQVVDADNLARTPDGAFDGEVLALPL